MRDTIESVASRTLDHDYRVWGFGEGMALLGLLRAGDRYDRPEWIDAVADLVVPSLGWRAEPTDHLIPVEVLVELHRLRPGIRVDAAVARFVAAVWRDGAPLPVHRPDLVELGDTVWVDCMHTDSPGLALAGQPDAATAAMTLACARLQDESGLFSHGFTTSTGLANGVHWGRGQGWALHGLVALPPADPERDAAYGALRRRASRLLAALARHENGPGRGSENGPGRGPENGAANGPEDRHERDGTWRTIVDDPAAPVEHSVSALVAAGIYHGLRTGMVDPSRRALADRSLRAAVTALDGYGGLPVSAATPAGTTDSYLHRTTGVFPWGQGPLLLALLDAATP
ncbi:rhamnogalacturonyl hydrolase YesR [Allocatelliglobosispora scoriae]|uniref:Rhamnogalacturonyl hydrolase YesR n=1 Tax=Allocatelliglobosispora scoriae TaxID=643052 RepID=A0A841C3Y4_9ACTN|nr:glycoside hydrolase family 88 protein [Allocatelliglobosispora scoriae]MBB5874478.1 rhamnogalacturonyl hydrolase YesR [Allocatelliglobosispora scoriae]